MNNSLNDIVLSGSMLENLYRLSLVDMDVSEQRGSPHVKFLGNNARNVTVLIHNAEFAFLPEDQLSFLSKMLMACKMNMGDVAISNLANGATIAEVTAQLKPQAIIAFGVSVAPGVSALTIGNFNNASLLQAPDLSDLVKESEEAKQLKGKLWACLKTLFNIA